MPTINPNSPQTLFYGDNAFGISISEPAINATGATATLAIVDRYTGVQNDSYWGATATISQADPAIIEYSFPEPFTNPLPSGDYLVWFVITFSDGTQGSTSSVFLRVLDATIAS